MFPGGVGEERDSFTLKLVSKSNRFNLQNNANSEEEEDEINDDSMDFNDQMPYCGMSETTAKWNPLSFAVYNGNLDLIEHIFSKTSGNAQRFLKIPGNFKTQEINRLFPFVVAVRQNNLDMFRFFWEQLNYVYCKEDTFENLFRLLAKKDKSEFVQCLVESKQTKCLFQSMSYSYRSEFIDNLL
mmetsp:Transcript_3440/g.5843  ORF Transcript_3440/g.5843 Transcript_3440/m.5843 type:complete len:184 (-) Transcript_3440:756-1307(-)